MSTGKQVDTPQCLEVIADLIKSTLTCLLRDPQEEDYKLFYTILESSGNLYTIVNGTRKHHLWSMLTGHPIWMNTKYWKQCCLEIVNMKIEEAKKRQVIKAANTSSDDLQQNDTANQGSGNSGGEKKNNFFKKGLTSLKGLLSSKPQAPNLQ